MNIDWSQIETVLLDMDGTLLDLHFDNYFWRHHMPQVYARQHGVSLEDTYQKLEPMFQSLEGTLDWYCVDYWSQALGVDVMALKRQVADRIAYRPNAQVFLQHCVDQVGDVRMVTNGHRKVLNLKIEHTQIDQYFNHMVCSHELDYPKEEQEFWHSLQQTSSFDPAKTLFVDDNEAVLNSAAEYGIQHLYSIAKPDSQRERERPSDYPMIEVF